MQLTWRCLALTSIPPASVFFRELHTKHWPKTPACLTFLQLCNVSKKLNSHWCRSKALFCAQEATLFLVHWAHNAFLTRMNFILHDPVLLLEAPKVLLHACCPWNMVLSLPGAHPDVVVTFPRFNSPHQGKHNCHNSGCLTTLHSNLNMVLMAQFVYNVVSFVWHSTTGGLWGESTIFHIFSADQPCRKKKNILKNVKSQKKYEHFLKKVQTEKTPSCNHFTKKF